MGKVGPGFEHVGFWGFGTVPYVYGFRGLGFRVYVGCTGLGFRGLAFRPRTLNPNPYTP